MLAMLHRVAGREPSLRQELDWLRAANRERTGFFVGGSLVVALEDAGLWRECLDVLQPLLERFPNSAAFWRQCATCQYQLGELDQALASIDRSIALGYDKWSYFWRYKICFTGKQDVDEAARSLFACYVLDNAAEQLTENLRTMASAEAYLRVREVARTYPCADAVRERLLVITEDVLRSSDNKQATSTLASHLERIVIAVRNAGATPVMLCYPWWNEADTTLRAAALEQGAQFIEVGKLFEAGRGATPPQLLRAPDGHCNDAGYQLMASIVEAQLLPLVQAAGK
jgi:tetratricopeptide (TPR) repeat protein